MPQRHDSITEALSRLINLQPFFATYLLGEMKIVEDNSIPTADTDGMTIRINTDFFEGMTVAEREFVLAHEVFHGIFEHLSRMKAYASRGVGPDMKKWNGEQWNHATDHIINHILQQAGVGSMPKDALTDPRVKVDTLADDHYQVVKVPPKPPGNGGGHGAGATGSHTPPPNGKSPSPQHVKRAVAQARNAAKAQGKMPADLERLIDGIVEPKHDWKEQLANVMATAMGRDSQTWARPNRRRLATMDLYLPGSIGYSTAQVAVVVDTSGSVSEKELSAFMGELNGILEMAKPELCKVFWVDAEVAGIDEVDEFTDLTQLKAKGGGGTNMEAAWPVIVEEMDAQEVTAVVLTDGYTTTTPETKPTFPVIWVSSGSQDLAYGDVIELTVDES